MTDDTDQTGKDADDGAGRKAALVHDLDALRRGLEAEPPLPPDDVRRRIDAIADAFLDLDEDRRGDPPGSRDRTC